MIQMEHRIILEPDPEDGGYVADCPALPGCYSQGDTREEAISNAREVIAAYIGSLRKDGLPIPGDVELEIVRLRCMARLPVLSGFSLPTVRNAPPRDAPGSTPSRGGSRSSSSMRPSRRSGCASSPSSAAAVG